jgi:hypothetical protein
MITPENRIAVELLLLAAFFASALVLAHSTARKARTPQQAHKAA